VQLVDARELWVKMRKSLGEKRKAISPEQIEEITLRGFKTPVPPGKRVIPGHESEF